MQRLQVIQRIIDGRNLKSYLEIGVNYGSVFLNVRAKQKFGIDPFFRKKFWPKYLLHKLLSLGKSSMSCYPVTSDKFFENHAAKVLRNGIDLVFVDGMHEYNYAFRDTTNALKYLNKGGVIILHDCNPQTEQNTASFQEWVASGRSFPWNGDVWKAVVLLRSTRPDIQVFVGDTDFGLGIVTPGEQQTLPYSAAEIENLQYSDLEHSREDLINLKSLDYLKNYIKS